MSNLVQRLRSGRHNIENETLGGVDHDRRCLEAADEIERLQRIIDSRPAINAGLPETYIAWSQSIYVLDAIAAGAIRSN